MESDPPATDDAQADEPGWQTPPPTLRRIDWLAVAPWTLIFRAPGVACRMAPLIAGFWLLLAFGSTSSEVAAPQGREIVVAAARGANQLGLVWSSPEISVSWVSRLAVRVVVGSYVLCAAAGWAAGRFNDDRTSASWRASWRVASRRAHHALLAVLITIVPGVVLIGVGLLMDSLAGAEATSSLAGLLRLGAQLNYLIGWIACLACLVAAPFMATAVAVDSADSFDAASRGVAYVTQQPLVTLWCFTLSFLVTVAGGLFVETLLAGAAAMPGWVGQLSGDQPPVPPESPTLSPFLLAGVRSYYAASWIACTVATYLVLRQHIDGQPLDEIELGDDQPSAA